MVDLADGSGRPSLAWPVVGNFPVGLADASRFETAGDGLKIGNTSHGLRTTVEITLPDAGDPVELWTITVENLSETARSIKVVPYLEWVLNRPEADRGHTQYNRLFAEMEYVSGPACRAGLGQAREGHGHPRLGPRAGGLPDLADRFHRPCPERLDATGARDAGTSRRPRDTPAHPTLDPIGSLLIGLTLPARGSSRVRLLIGLAGDRSQAIDLIARHLQIGGPIGKLPPPTHRGEAIHPIGHGEIPPGTSPSPTPSSPRTAGGSLVRTPFTPRPFDHTMSNALGHVLVGDQSRAAHELERQFPAEPPDARLVRHRHAGGPRRGVLPLRSRRRGVVLADLSSPERRRRRRMRSSSASTARPPSA